MSSRSLSHLLSDICDDVYRDTPQIKNELLNRRVLSSAAAKARRNLIEAMLVHADQAKLEISGFPPELSMYRSLLEINGIHRSGDGGYFFAAPYAKSSVYPAWNAIERFFKESELEKTPDYGTVYYSSEAALWNEDGRCASAFLRSSHRARYRNCRL